MQAVALMLGDLALRFTSSTGRQKTGVGQGCRACSENRQKNGEGVQACCHVPLSSVEESAKMVTPNRNQGGR